MLKFAILLLSILTVFAGAAVSPALADIARAFPHVDTTGIKSLLTAPAITIVLTTPFVGFLERLLGQKVLLVGGLVIYVVGGVGAGLVGDFTALFALRLLLGVGIGIIMPMSTALIAQYYAGPERVQMMGWSSSMTNLGSILANLLAGYLTLITWRWAFGIYGIAMLVLLAAIVAIPRHRPTVNAGALSRAPLPLSVYGWAAGMFFLMLGTFAIPVNMALFLTENGIGGSRESGIAVSLMTGTGFVAGLLLRSIRKVLGASIFVVMLVAVGAGFWLLSQALTFPAVLLAMVFIGFGNGCLMPMLFVGASEVTEGSRTVSAMAVMTALIFIGQFCSPLLLDALSHLLGDGSYRFIFSTVAVGFLVAAALVALSRGGRVFRAGEKR